MISNMNVMFPSKYFKINSKIVNKWKMSHEVVE